jgi:hypothetical protein
MKLKGLKPALFLFTAAALHAAVSGTVTNNTTGKPQAGATVTLYRLGTQTGLEALANVKTAADGTFQLDQTPAGGPHLIQTAWAGVTYNHMLPPTTPTEGLALEVWDASATPPKGVKITTHLTLLEPVGSVLRVTESWLWANTGTLTFNNSKGTHRFSVAQGMAGKLKATGTAPQGQPIERAALPTGSPNVMAIDFPIKPGQTRIDVNYEMPYADGTRFQTRVLPGDVAPRLVTPSGAKLEGTGLTELGVEPESQATIYNFTGTQIDAKVTGVGVLQEEAEAPTEDEAPGVQQVRPFLYDRIYWIAGLVTGIAALAMVTLYRRSA